MAEPMVVPWRAGRRPGENPAFAAGELVAFPGFSATGDVLLADISSWQPDIADSTYIQDFSEAVIIRAMYGTSVDAAWYNGARRTELHGAGAKFLGIYQYLTPGQDALAQADALGNLLGSLQPGEKVLLDIEEGAGNQQSRWETWADRIAQLGNDPWDYSGLDFAATAGLQPVDWVADYTSLEPSVPHKLWQFTDSYSIPGIPGDCDCSLFHGTIAQLAAYAYSKPDPKPTPKPVQETDNMPGGVIAGPLANYPVSFELGSVNKIVFYANSPATLTVHIAHGGTPAENEAGSLFNAGTLTVSPRAEYVITNPADVDAIVLTDISGPVGWHTE